MEITKGIHTVAEILDLCGIVIDPTYDRRRISIGGLKFQEPDEIIRVPENALTLEVTLDGQTHTEFTVV